MDDMSAEGDVINDVPDREIVLRLTETELRGRLANVTLQLYNVSKRTAVADSAIKLCGPVAEGAIDALPGVRICAKAGEGCALQGIVTLPSGGIL